MTLNDILTLAKAGFTKADVMQIMSQAEQQPAAQQPAVQQPEAQPVTQQPAAQQPAVQQPEAQPAAQQTQTEAQPQSIEARLDYLINRVNLMAVNNSNNPAPAGESVDDILASIINPKE